MLISDLGFFCFGAFVSSFGFFSVWQFLLEQRSSLRSLSVPHDCLFHRAIGPRNDSVTQRRVRDTWGGP